jgi:conjugative transposon TraN protein
MVKAALKASVLLSIGLCSNQAIAQQASSRDPYTGSSKPVVTTVSREADVDRGVPSKAYMVQNFNSASLMTAYNLLVTHNKTTSLIFPASIISVDIGSLDIIGEQAQGVKNVLKLKATGQGFEETTISVITADGSFYTFLANYSPDPAYLSVNLKNEAVTISGGRTVFPGDNILNSSYLVFDDVLMSESEIEQISSSLVNSRRNLKHVGSERHNMKFTLDGIYIKDNVLFFQLKSKNNSHIRYDIDFIKFYVRDKKITKNTTVQELELEPISKYNTLEAIEGKSESVSVVALQKFTIPEDKDLVIEMYEKNGGRHLSFSLDNDEIVNAKLIR